MLYTDDDPGSGGRGRSASSGGLSESPGEMLKRKFNEEKKAEYEHEHKSKRAA
jgi:hypothetical protein